MTDLLTRAREMQERLKSPSDLARVDVAVLIAELVAEVERLGREKKQLGDALRAFQEDIADLASLRERAQSAEAARDKAVKALGEIAGICEAPATSTCPGERELQLAEAVHKVFAIAMAAIAKEATDGK